MTDRDRIIEERARAIEDITARYAVCTAETGADTDAFYMRAAVELAELAAGYGDVPVGCVIVRDGKIIAADCNGREVFRDAAYHAETAAVSAACRKLGGWRLTRCTLYVTLEPCPMCAGAVWCARVPRVVVGAKDLTAYPLNHKFDVTFGVLEKECRGVLTEFFQARRRKQGAAT